MIYLKSLRKIRTDELNFYLLTRLEGMALTKPTIPCRFEKDWIVAMVHHVYLPYWHRYQSVRLTVCPLTTMFVL